MCSSDLTNYPIQVYNDSGEVMHIRVSAAMLDIEDGNVAILSYIDETEHVRQNAALRESESLWRTLIDALPTAVWRKDNEARLIGCNTRFEELAGKMESELVGTRESILATSQLIKDEPRQSATQLLPGEIGRAHV